MIFANKYIPLLAVGVTALFVPFAKGQTSGTCATASNSGDFSDNSNPYTSNTLAYMCESMGISYPTNYFISDSDGSISEAFDCEQIDGENGIESTASMDCTGIGTGTITCFVYAATGKTSGSCGSCIDNFADDGTVSGGDLAFADSAAGNACIGQATCDMTATLAFDNPKFKVLAYCGEDLSTGTPTGSPTSTPTASPTSSPTPAPAPVTTETACNLEAFGSCVCDTPVVNVLFAFWCFPEVFPWNGWLW